MQPKAMPADDVLAANQAYFEAKKELEDDRANKKNDSSSSSGAKGSGKDGGSVVAAQSLAVATG